jgi:mono/diheme cytochrome c family protein
MSWRPLMKKMLIALVLFMLAAPAGVLADPKIDFNAKCSICHRANKNLPKVAMALKVDPNKLSLRTSRMNREEMIAITEKGREKMPGFGKELTRQQIEEVIDYIIALKNRK